MRLAGEPLVRTRPGMNPRLHFAMICLAFFVVIFSEVIDRQLSSDKYMELSLWFLNIRFR